MINILKSGTTLNTTTLMDDPSSVAHTVIEAKPRSCCTLSGSMLTLVRFGHVKVTLTDGDSQVLFEQEFEIQ